MVFVLVIYSNSLDNLDIIDWVVSFLVNDGDIDSIIVIFMVMVIVVNDILIIFGVIFFGFIDVNINSSWDMF